MAAILKIQNGGRYSSQITCLHFLYDSNNKKLSIHKISCFYDNLNNIATNRSLLSTLMFSVSTIPIKYLSATFVHDLSTKSNISAFNAQNADLN